jgi:hypothetical protein
MADTRFATTFLGRRCKPLPGRPLEWQDGTIQAVWADDSNMLWFAVETDGGRVHHVWATSVQLIS